MNIPGNSDINIDHNHIINEIASTGKKSNKKCIRLFWFFCFLNYVLFLLLISNNL